MPNAQGLPPSSERRYTHHGTYRLAIPDGVTALLVEAIGAGAGGGAGTYQGNNGSNGGDTVVSRVDGSAVLDVVYAYGGNGGQAPDGSTSVDGGAGGAAQTGDSRTRYWHVNILWRH